MPCYQLGDHEPQIAASAWVAPSAELIGRVHLAARSSVWFGCVLRGDINEIRIGEESNIQDGVVIHLSDALPTLVGKRVTVGHQALLHACTIGDNVLVGMGAIIMDGAVIGANSIVGAQALVTGGSQFPPGSMILGSPAKVVRQLSEKEQSDLSWWADAYTSKLDHYRAHCRPLPSSEPV